MNPTLHQQITTGKDPIELRMLYDIQRRKEIFRTNPKDSAYDEPFGNLYHDYSKGLPNLFRWISETFPTKKQIIWLDELIFVWKRGLKNVVIEPLMGKFNLN